MGLTVLGKFSLDTEVHRHHKKLSMDSDRQDITSYDCFSTNGAIVKAVMLLNHRVCGTATKTDV